MEKLTKRQRRELKKQEMQEELKKESRRRFLKTTGVWLGVVLLIGTSIFGLIKLTGPSPTVLSETAVNLPPVSSTDVTVGQPKGEVKVTLVEYSDFQCPACASQYPFVKQLLADYPEKVLFVYRFFPLSNKHKNARISAQASLAAYHQGKFSEMEDMLFTNQQNWAENDTAQDVFIEYAQKIGLDVGKFKDDMNSSQTQNFIINQENAALSLGINSTPTFFLNGKQIQNPRSYEEFKQLVEEELKK